MSRRWTGGGGGSKSAGAASLVFSNFGAARPSSAMGDALTPGQNAFGAYVELASGAEVSTNIYRVRIGLAGTNVSGQAKDTLVKIATGAAAAEVVIIANLFCSNQSATSAGGYIWYDFPLFIAAGTRLSACASTNNATVGTVRALIELYTAPAGVSVKAGTAVETLGATEASSAGTAITPGGAAEGSWTTIGTTTNDAWWFQLGVGINNGTQDAGAGVAAFDVAVGDDATRLLTDVQFANNIGEAIIIASSPLQAQALIPGGSTIKVRGQHSGTAVAGYSAIVYAVTGSV